MRLTKRLIGKRIRRPYWKADNWFQLKLVGYEIVVFENQDGMERIFDRDDYDVDWIHLPDVIEKGDLMPKKKIKVKKKVKDKNIAPKKTVEEKIDDQAEPNIKDENPPVEPAEVPA